MFKNKEFGYFVFIQLSFTSVILILYLLHFVPAFLTFALISCGLILSNVIFHRYRYQEIQKLTAYLAKLQNGEHTLDFRDNREGELSILKSELYKLSIKLNSQAELLLRDKTYLADSLSDISHQLKTPLTSMKMMVDFLEDESLPKEKREQFLQNMNVGIERMEWLIQALLKLSKLDADAVNLKTELIEVSEILKEAVQPLLISLEVREIELNIEKLEEPVYFQGDYQWICEALTNIIKNCMEHTKASGKIKLSYSDNNLYTKIEIQDTGTGIDPEDLPHIFERFYKGKNSRKDSVGIGLALSKEIITRQKGKILVNSILSEGSTFEIRFYR